MHACAVCQHVPVLWTEAGCGGGQRNGLDGGVDSTPVCILNILGCSETLVLSAFFVMLHTKVVTVICYWSNMRLFCCCYPAD